MSSDDWESESVEMDRPRKRYKQALEPEFDMRRLPMSTRYKWENKLKEARKSTFQSNFKLFCNQSFKIEV